VLRVRGEGCPARSGRPAGDLLIVLRVLDHPVFQRHGLDLVLAFPVSFVQAALGDTLTVPTLDGEEELDLPAGTQPQACCVSRGWGSRPAATPRSARAGRREDPDEALLRAERDSPLVCGHEGVAPKGKKWWNL